MQQKAIFGFAVLAAAVCGVGMLAMPNSGAPPEMPRPPAGMAPLAGDGAKFAYFKLEFLPDGFPARRTSDGLIPHPIYGTYVLINYLNQHDIDPQSAVLESAKKVANLAVARMTARQDALVFLYPPGLASMTGEYYSGLTQGHYLTAFRRLHKKTGDPKHAEFADRIFNSLLIPVSERGVLKQTPYGPVLEEWPHEIASYTLNGWASTLLAVHNYAEYSGSVRAKKLFNDSLKAMEAMLPFYDVPSVANTRYRLSGQAQIRLSFTKPARLTAFSTEIPGEGKFALKDGSKSIWDNHIRQESPSQITVNAVLNRISHPKPNILHFKIEAPEAGETSVLIGTGPYDPGSTGLPVKAWDEIAKVTLKAGRNEIALPVPWHQAELVVYPTNFKKKLAGKFYNSYHFIHVATLRSLHAISGLQGLKHYADKWDGYVDLWPNMPQYSNADIQLTPYGARKSE